VRENPTDEELRLAEREDAASDSLDPEIHQRMHLLKLRQGLPVYHHDCSKCISIGTYSWGAGSLRREASPFNAKGDEIVESDSCGAPYWDYYYCPKTISLIARYGCLGYQYISSKPSIIAEVLNSDHPFDADPILINVYHKGNAMNLFPQKPRNRNPLDDELRDLERSAQHDPEALYKLFLKQARIDPEAAQKTYVTGYKGVTILTPTVFTEEFLEDILISAFEGGVYGSGSWVVIFDYEYPPGLSEADFSEGGLFNQDRYIPRYGRLPLVPGGAVILADNQDYDRSTETASKTYRLDREALIKGLEKMAIEVPAAFASLSNANFDAGIADLVIQYSIFGKHVYG
jgi:hypothetical protein